MNKSNFNQTGGFPLETERLQELQTAYQAFNAFGMIAGDLTIISGCEKVGSTIQNGFVFINNEIFEFREAVVADDSAVIIIEEPAMRSFENGTSKTVHTVRYATFGTAETSWPWTSFVRPVQTKTLEARLSLMERKLAIFQEGGVVFPWFKEISEIPAGFQIVTDMEGKTIFGYDASQTEFNEIKKVGGLKNKQLTIAELPKVSPVNGTGFKKGGSFGGTTGLTISDSPAGDFAPGELIKPFGEDQPFSILNPYITAVYIEFAE